MIKTLIGIPCMSMVHTDFMDSFIKLQKPPGTSYTIIKNTLIHDSRAIIAQNAIEAGFDRVFWMDSDMIFPPDALVQLSADMDTGIEFVSGLYVSRRPPNIRPVTYKRMWYEVKEDNTYEAGAVNYYDYPEGLSEVEATGFGCCLTSVDLLKRVGDKWGAMFQPIPCMGEDLSFCWRAKEMGVKMYLDSRVKCGHIGEYVFTEKDCTPMHLDS